MLQKNDLYTIRVMRGVLIAIWIFWIVAIIFINIMLSGLTYWICLVIYAMMFMCLLAISRRLPHFPTAELILTMLLAFGVLGPQFIFH